MDHFRVTSSLFTQHSKGFLQNLAAALLSLHTASILLAAKV